MRAARSARAHHDIPCIIITVSALARRERGWERRGWEWEEEGFLIYSWLEYKMASHVRRIFASRAGRSRVPGTREKWISCPLRKEEKNQFAGVAERHDTPRRDRSVRMAGWRLRYFSLSSNRHSIFSSAAYSRITPCVELIMKFLKAIEIWFWRFENDPAEWIRKLKKNSEIYLSWYKFLRFNFNYIKSITISVINYLQVVGD